MKIILFLVLLNFLSAYQNKYLQNASLALRSGLYEEALLHINDSKKIDPINPEIYKIEGLLHEALGNRKEAIQAWKNCLKHSKKRRELVKESKNHLKNLLID